MGRGKKFITQSQSYDLSSALSEARETAYCKESIEAAQRAVALSRRRTFRSSLLQDLLHSSKREDSNRHFNNERTNSLIAENAKRKRIEFLLDQGAQAQQLFKLGNCLPPKNPNTILYVFFSYVFTNFSLLI